MHITDLSAQVLAEAIQQREVSCHEVMRAYLERIHALNPRLNAIVNLADDEPLLRQADERDADLARGVHRGWLHGMPQAIKDTAHAVGFPTTFGCTLLHDALPAQDSVYVARMKSAGAIIIGKTNMPEFGLGSHTYNNLFGATPNAWDAAVSAGGSSGGAAVALAQRLLPVADGSDFMGSLRNPAGWNHLFGLRPSAGRVPAWPKPELYVSQLGTDGPLGRSVTDLARLLSIQAGHDPRAPLSMADAVNSYVPGTDASLRGVRVGWLADLGGYLPVEPGIVDVCEQALEVMAGGGAEVEPAALGFDAEQIWAAWLVWRRALVAPSVAAALYGAPSRTQTPAHAQARARAQIKPEALWEYDRAQDLTFSDFMAASVVRGNFANHLLSLFERFDVLALPVAQVWPFAIDLPWPRQINGRTMDTYHRWMEVTIYATFAGLPAISMPAGFDTAGRWPMGLQLIGRPQGDAALLNIAAAYESLVPALLQRRPPDPAAAADQARKTSPLNE